MRNQFYFEFSIKIIKFAGSFRPIMVLMTMIARVFDGLPLAASVQEDEQTGKYVLNIS